MNAIHATAVSAASPRRAPSFMGALIIQTLTTTILTRGIPVQLTLVVKSIVVLAVCLLQSPRVQRAIGNSLARLRGRPT